MSSISAFGGIAADSGRSLVPNGISLKRQPEATAVVDNKIEKSAKEFESILLGSWLQQADQSFGSLPGGDEDGDADAGKDQMQGMAMQSLGRAMTAAGGIGISKMISTHLHKAEDARVAAETKAHGSAAK